MRPSVFSAILSVFCVLALAAFLFVRWGAGVTMVEETRFLMGTVVQIKVPITSVVETGRAEDAVRKAFNEIARVERVFSSFKANSEISRINRTAGYGPVGTTDEVLSLVEKAIEYNKKTGGVFDITIKPLVDLWYNAKVSGRLPAEAEVRKAQGLVGSDHIAINRINNTIAFRKYGMGIDMGGIAKGYATDRAAMVLKARGINNAIVNSGGDMYCLGTRPAGEMWRVGIQHPRNKEKIFFELKVKDMAVDTSGDYERYFTLDGKRYAHIIDPRTGYPIGDDVVSATVVSKESATPLATALCILGKDALKMIDSMKGVDAVIIYNDRGTLKFEASEGMKRYGIVKE